jgi:hypothetical protein
MKDGIPCRDVMDFTSISWLNLVILEFEVLNALQMSKLHKLVPKGLHNIYNKGFFIFLNTIMHQMAKPTG